MKKSFYLLYFFILSLLIFKQPVLAEEPNVIKLSELEDGQSLEINGTDTTLELDTDKSLSKILIQDCTLTINGDGNLTLDTGNRDHCLIGYGSQLIINSGSIINDHESIIGVDIVMNGGNITAPKTAMFGNITINDGNLYCYYTNNGAYNATLDIKGGNIHADSLIVDRDSTINISGGNIHSNFLQGSDNATINISGGNIECSFILSPTVNITGGHIDCSAKIECSSINIADNMTILTPRNDDPSDGLVNSGSSFGSSRENIPIQIVPIDEVTPLEGISLDTSSYTLGLHESVDLNVIFAPDNASNKYIQWSSSDYHTVFVNENGKAYASSYGSAIITATSEDGNYTASCEIKVERSKDSQKGLVFEFSPNGSESPNLVKVTYDGIPLEKNDDYKITYNTNDENGNFIVAIDDILRTIQNFN